MGDPHTGSIIGLLPDLVEQYTVPGGEGLDDLHVTLLYLTDDYTTLTDDHRRAITSVMMDHRDIIECSIVGVRRLGNDDPQATVLMLDSPELQALRVAVKAELAEFGVPVPEDTYPDYLPHITVGYGTSLDDAEKLTGLRVTLGTLAAFYGPDREHVALYGRPTAEQEGTTMGERFFAPSIARMGVPTGDDRLILPGAISYRTLPIAYRWQEFDAPGHDGAVVIGAVDRIEIDPVTGNVAGYGELANPDIIPEVNRARELMRLGVLGISIDPGEVVAEVMPNGMTLFSYYEISSFTALPIPAFSDTRVMLVSDSEGSEATEVDHNDLEPLHPDDDYGWLYSLTASIRSEGWGEMDVYPADTAWDGDAAADRVLEWATDGDTVDWARYAQAFLYQNSDADPELKGSYGFGIADVTDGQLSIVPKAVYAAAGALSGARGGTTIPEADQQRMRSVIRGIYDHIADELDDDSIEAPFSLVACAADRPPLAWFKDPQLTEPTPITITADGQIFGHIGEHGKAHRGLPGKVTIPKSMSGYREFLLGGTMTAEGVLVPTGNVTLGGGHADGMLGMKPSVEHYDDVSTSVAAVAAGDDQFGVWIAGAIKPGVTAEQIDLLYQSPPSGDWRSDELGHLELMTVHSVNTPGFAVYRVKVGMRDDQVYSLIASSAMVKRPESAKEAFSVDLDGDLETQFADAGVPWPQLSMTISGIEYGPVPIAAGCVLRMLRDDSEMGKAGDVEFAGTESERARARARLALAMGGM